MVKEIIKDIEFLSQISVKYEEEKHKDIISDLLDTANANTPKCVGLASVQIGQPVKLIAVFTGQKFEIMKNPLILSHGNKTYIASEGCLSVDGVKDVRRFNQITVLYTDIKGKPIKRVFKGIAAQIIQHECDHLKGVII